MKKDTRMQFPTSFGVFSPTGHVVMAFATDGEAERARRLLLTALRMRALVFRGERRASYREGARFLASGDVRSLLR